MPFLLPFALMLFLIVTPPWLVEIIEYCAVWLASACIVVYVVWIAIYVLGVASGTIKE